MANVFNLIECAFRASTGLSAGKRQVAVMWFSSAAHPSFSAEVTANGVESLRASAPMWLPVPHGAVDLDLAPHAFFAGRDFPPRCTLLPMTLAWMGEANQGGARVAPDREHSWRAGRHEVVGCFKHHFHLEGRHDPRPGLSRCRRLVHGVIRI